MSSRRLLVGIRLGLSFSFFFFIFQTARLFRVRKFIFTNRALQLIYNWLTTIKNVTWGRLALNTFFIQKVSFLLLNHKHFHFTDSKVFVSCEERGTILTEWTLVRVAETCPAVFRIWFTDNSKIMATPKYWPIVTAAIDGISFFSRFQGHLFWWQIAWVDKAEQERAWCFCPISWP